MIEGIVLNVIDGRTAEVSIVEISRHPLYNKIVRKNKKVMCNVEGVSINEGDKVFIKPSRPYSKMKKHVVVKKA